MDSKKNMEYLQKTINKWLDVIDVLSPSDNFINICNKRITIAKEELQRIKDESPEDFLI